MSVYENGNSILTKVTQVSFRLTTNNAPFTVYRTKCITWVIRLFPLSIAFTPTSLPLSLDL